MRIPYLESIGGMWRRHAAAPLRASEIALYSYIAHKAHANGWRMPVFVANGLMCPMLFEKSTLETARKRLMQRGLIECRIPKGNCSCPSYTIKDFSESKIGNDGQSEPKPASTKAKKEAEEQENYFLEAMANLWTAFEEEAFNANEIALYAFLVHLAETHKWAMPFRCHDSEIAPVIMRIGALKEAREVLAQRGLVSFDLGDPKKTAPKYVILIGDNKPWQLQRRRRQLRPSPRFMVRMQPFSQSTIIWLVSLRKKQTVKAIKRKEGKYDNKRNERGRRYGNAPCIKLERCGRKPSPDIYLER